MYLVFTQKEENNVLFLISKTSAYEITSEEVFNNSLLEYGYRTVIVDKKIDILGVINSGKSSFDKFLTIDIIKNMFLKLK